MEIRSHVPTQNYKDNWELIFGNKDQITPLPVIDFSTSWTTGKTIPEINAIYAEAKETNTAIEEVIKTGAWEKRLEARQKRLEIWQQRVAQANEEGLNGEGFTIKEATEETIDTKTNPSE